MSNCMLCYPNYSDSATLSGGSWQAGASLANLQIRGTSRVARSTDLQESSCTIDVDFGRKRYLTAGAIVGHNLSLTSRIRCRLWQDTAKTLCVFDSGMCKAWPRWYKTKNLRWSDETFWGGQAPEIVRNSFPPIYVITYGTDPGKSTTVGVRAATWDIVDSANTAGYVELARMFMAEDWTPEINMEYGATMQWVDPTVVDRVMSGAKVFEQRPKYRQAVFTLKTMEIDEGVNKALASTCILGVSGELLYIFDPADKTKLQQTSFIGTLSELSPLNWHFYSLTSMSFKIEEVVG